MAGWKDDGVWQDGWWKVARLGFDDGNPITKAVAAAPKNPSSTRTQAMIRIGGKRYAAEMENATKTKTRSKPATRLDPGHKLRTTDSETEIVQRLKKTWL